MDNQVKVDPQQSTSLKSDLASSVMVDGPIKIPETTQFPIKSSHKLYVLGMILLLLGGLIIWFVLKTNEKRELTLKQTISSIPTITLAPTVNVTSTTRSLPTPTVVTSGFKLIEESAPEKMIWYQDADEGIAFYYPNNWKMSNSGSTYASLTTENSNNVQIELFPRSKNLTEDFSKDVIKRIAISCAADGPTGSSFCPEEKVTVKSFVNPQGVDGLRIRRVKETEIFVPVQSKEETVELVIAYELPFNKEYFAIAFMPFETELDEKIELVANSFQRMLQK